jgi:hypothetical protein
MTIIDDRPKVEAPSRTMHILNGKGDTRITWDPDNGAEVTEARGAFEKLRRDGWLLYRVDGEDREVIREFDPTAARIIAHPQIVGG